jgi:hypothetical protein
VSRCDGQQCAAEADGQGGRNGQHLLPGLVLHVFPPTRRDIGVKDMTNPSAMTAGGFACDFDGRFTAPILNLAHGLFRK